MFFRCVSLSLVCLAAAACSSKVPDEWKGYYYNRAGNEANRMYVGAYPTLNQCLDMTRAIAGDNSSYFCGYGCQTSLGGTEHCEKVMP